MADRRALRDEIQNDPLGLGYSGMSDQQIYDSLHAANRTRNRAELSGDEMRQATNGADFTGLTDHKRDLWISFCSGEPVDPFAQANADLVNWIFGSGSTTVANLSSLRTETVSRAVELGLGEITLHQISVARQ